MVLHRFLLTLMLVGVSACASTSPESANFNWQGNSALNRGDHARALEMYTEALALAGDRGSAIDAAVAMYGLGRANGYLCNLAEAEQWFERSILAREEIPDGKIGYITQNILELGRVHVAQGRMGDAVEQYRRALPMIEAGGIEFVDPLGCANMLEEYAVALEGAGDGVEAESIRLRAEQLRQQNSDRAVGYVSRPYPSDCGSSS